MSSTTALPTYPRLSKPLFSFYRWLWRWYQDTGDLSAGTAYYAKKQRRTERTIYRRFATLEAAGLVRREVEDGIEREVIPLVDPALLSPKKRQGSASGVRRSSRQGKRQGSILIETQETQTVTQEDTTTDTAPKQKPAPAPASDPGFAAAVEILRQEGMPETSAKQIAREIPDPRRLRDAVAYYRQRKAAGQNITNWVGYVLQVARLRVTAQATPAEASRSAPTPHRVAQQASGRHTEEWHERQAAAENRLTRANSDFLAAEAEARAKKKSAAEAERRAFLARKGVTV